MYLTNFFKIIGNYDFKKINFFFLNFLIFLHLLVYIKYKLNIHDLLKYIIIHIVYIIVPGLFFYSYFFQLNKNNIYEKFAFSFGFGIFFIIIQYFILQYFQKLYYVNFINPFICLIFFLYKKPKIYIKSSFLKILSSVELFATLFLIFIFIFGSIFASPPLSINEVASYMQDKLFNVGLMEGLSRSFPPPDVKAASLDLNYHGYFVFIYLTLVSYISGISNFEIYFYFSQYFKIVFFILSITYFSHFIFKKKKENNIFIFIAVFLACSSLFYNFFDNSGFFGNQNLFSITVFPNGYMHGLTYIFLIIPEIIKSLNHKTFSLKNLILFSLFLVMIFGSKAPNAVYIVGVIDLFLIFLLILRVKLSKQFLSLIFVTNIIFLIFYIFLYFNAQNNYSFEFHIGHLFRHHHEYNNLLEFIFYNFISLFFIPFHQILFHPFPVLISYLYLYSVFITEKNKKNYPKSIKNYLQNLIYLDQKKNYQELLIFSAILISLTSYFFWFSLGGSAYFMMMGTYFFSVFSLKILFSKKLPLSNKLKNLFFVLILVSIVSICFSSLKQITKGSLVFINTFVDKEECKNISNKNKNSLSKFKKYYPLDNCPDWDRITKYEFLGLNWIKNNTNKNSIILTDRFYYRNSSHRSDARYFYYSTFTERIMFLEGFYYWIDPDISGYRKKLIEKFYNKNTSLKNKKKFLKDNNIDYVILTNFLNNELVLENDYLDLVFKNRDLKIFKVK